MKAFTLGACCALLCSSLALAQVSPELVGTETMGAPGKNWFVAKTGNGGYIFDADTGDMHGLISLSRVNPAVEVDMRRRQFYAPESYYSRGVHGERTDIVAIYDFDNLSPVGEVEIPKKMAFLGFRRHVGLLGNGRYFLVFNMTPAQSISVVDVEERSFVGEISTPGCAMIMPVADADFMMICGDGTMQLIRLDAQGQELQRTRSKKFFDVLEDPIFDRPVPTASGWQLISHAGLVFDVSAEGTRIEVGKPWSLLGEDSAEDSKWRAGGGEFVSVHKATGLMYVLMHQAEEEYTHHESGTEIWVLDSRSGRKLDSVELEEPAYSLYVTQSDEPKLLVADEKRAIGIFDGISFRKERSIEESGPGAWLFEGF